MSQLFVPGAGGGGGGGGIDEIEGNVGSVTPVGGEVVIIGATGQLTTDGSGDTLTISYPTAGTQAMSPVVTQTGSNTFAITDLNTFQLCTSAGAMTLTVPANATVPFPVNAEIVVYQQGAGQVTIAPAGGVTINSSFSNRNIATRYSAACLKQTATNTWELFGSLTA